MSHTYIVGGMNGNRHVVGCCCCCHVVRRKMVWLCARQASNRTYAKRGEWEGLEGSASRWVGRFCQFWMEGGQKCTTRFIMMGDWYFLFFLWFLWLYTWLWAGDWAQEQENANKNLWEYQQEKRWKKRGIFATRDADLRKAVFQVIWSVVPGWYVY